MSERDRKKAAVAEEIVQMCVFALGDEKYAIDIHMIKEIIRPMKITALPGAPAFIDGMVSLRGEIIPVMDMRKRFDLPPSPTGDSRMIIVRVEGRWVGIKVDAVSEVIRIPKKDVKPSPRVVGGDGARYLGGVCRQGDELVILLNLNEILSSEEKIRLKELKSSK